MIPSPLDRRQKRRCVDPSFKHDLALNYQRTVPFRWSKWSLFLVVSFIIFAPLAVRGEAPKLKQTEPRNAKKLKLPSADSFPGPVIPGLRQKAIPQGLAYAAAQDKIFISHYFDDGPACVSILDGSTGKMIASVTLKEPSGEFHRGHVGGIAILKEELYIASDGQILQYKLAPFLQPQPPESISAITAQKCEAKAAYCTSTKDYLFVGEFANGRKYPTETSHHLKDRVGIPKQAWICGYESGDPLGQPKCLLSVRKKVQGMCVSGNRIFLSLSFGRRNRSTIVVYRNPIGQPAHKKVQLSNGDSVPLWFLDGKNYLGEIDFPPMSEEITMIKNRLAVLAESGAGKYQFLGKGSLDRILYLDVSSIE